MFGLVQVNEGVIFSMFISLLTVLFVSFPNAWANSSGSPSLKFEGGVRPSFCSSEERDDFYIHVFDGLLRIPATFVWVPPSSGLLAEFNRIPGITVMEGESFASIKISRAGGFRSLGYGVEKYGLVEKKINPSVRLYSRGDGDFEQFILVGVDEEILISGLRIDCVTRIIDSFQKAP